MDHLPKNRFSIQYATLPHIQTDNNIPKAVSQQSTPLVHIIVKGNKVAFSLRQPKIAYLNDQFLININMC